MTIYPNLELYLLLPVSPTHGFNKQMAGERHPVLGWPWWKEGVISTSGMFEDERETCDRLAMWDWRVWAGEERPEDLAWKPSGSVWKLEV